MTCQGDELEHVKTMVACQQLNLPVMSPHDRAQKKREEEEEAARSK